MGPGKGRFAEARRRPSPGVGLALRLALLTGAGPGEVVDLPRSEIEKLNEVGTARWIIPVKPSKNGLTHFFPLWNCRDSKRFWGLELISHNNEHRFPSPSGKR